MTEKMIDVSIPAGTPIGYEAEREAENAKMRAVIAEADKRQANARRDATKSDAAAPLLASRNRLRGVREALATTRNGRTAGVELTKAEMLASVRDSIDDPTKLEQLAITEMVDVYHETSNLDRALNAGFEVLEA
jgi:hypothetical protein